MDIKKEIIASTISAVTQKSSEVSYSLLTKGRVEEVPVTLKRIGTGAAMTTAGVFLDGSGFKGVVAKIFRTLGMKSIAKSSLDAAVNQMVNK